MINNPAIKIDDQFNAATSTINWKERRKNERVERKLILTPFAIVASLRLMIESMLMIQTNEHTRMTDDRSA